MFLYLMDIYAWIFVIAIGATVLLLAFYGLARVLYAVAPVIGALYLLAFIYGILGIIYGMISKWPEVAVPVLFFAVLFAAYKYFRRKPALPLSKADMPVNFTRVNEFGRSKIVFWSRVPASRGNRGFEPAFRRRSPSTVGPTRRWPIAL